MTKSTRDVSTCSVLKSSPEAFISPVFFKNSFTFGGGNVPFYYFHDMIAIKIFLFKFFTRNSLSNQLSIRLYPCCIANLLDAELQ